MRMILIQLIQRETEELIQLKLVGIEENQRTLKLYFQIPKKPTSTSHSDWTAFTLYPLEEIKQSEIHLKLIRKILSILDSEIF